MKKIVFLSLFALCLPWTLVAQSIDDDLYYTPSKNKEEKKEEVKQEKKSSCSRRRDCSKVECADHYLFIAGKHYCCSKRP